jgi:hypothetical protein
MDGGMSDHVVIRTSYSTLRQGPLQSRTEAAIRQVKACSCLT